MGTENNVSLLTLINASPRQGVDLNISTLPTFVLEFNQPVNANLVNTAQGLNQFIILLRRDQDGGTSVPVTSGSVDPLGRTLTFQPAVSLTPGASYQITVRKELRSATGRGMQNDRTWTFTVDASFLPQIQLLSPGDLLGFPTPPTLTWLGVAASGNITYRVEVDESFLFGPPAMWSSAQTVGTSGGYLSANIGISLAQRTEFFWHVRAETASATGDWSETRSFFLGDAIHPSPDTQQLYDPAPFFRLTNFMPENGTTNQTSHPTILATFSQPIDPSTVTLATVQFFYGPVDGRTEIPVVQDLNAVYNVGGGQILIAPSVVVQPNQRYTVVLQPQIGSLSGNILNETFDYYYTSFYKPLYGGIIGVRSRLGGFVNTISDDEILFFLWRASMHVNELLATRVFRVRDRVSYDELVAYDPPFKTFGQYQYAELYAAVHILESFYFDILGDAGRRVALSTFEYEVQVTILNEVRERIKEMRKEMFWWGGRYLRETTLPRVGMKSQFWNPIREQNPLARDWSFHPRRRF